MRSSIEDPVLTVTEAAAYRRVSEATVRRDAAAGRYERVWLNKVRWGIRKSAIDANMARSKEPDAA
jgi:DeoR/GlpR family transcriptional regulator of sugar metabolism